MRVVPTLDYRQGLFTYVKKDGTKGQLTPSQITAQADPLHIGPNTAVLKLLQQYPVPNDITVGDQLNTSGFRFKSSTPLRYNTYIARLDYQLDENGKHQIFWRGNLQNDHFTPSDGVPQFPGQPDSKLGLENDKGFALGYTWLAKSNLVSNFRYGLTRQSVENTGLQQSPYTVFRGIDQLYSGSRGLSAVVPVHNFAEDVSWTRGAHSLAFGGVARFISNSRVNFGNSFSRGYANASWLNGTGKDLLVPDAKNSTVYVRLMTDLLGIISERDAQYNYDIQGNVLPEGAGIKRKFLGEEYEMYAQDTWKLSRGLTVTGGLRLSFFPPIHEANHIQTSSNVPLGDWFNMRGGLADQGKPQSLAPVLSFQLANTPGGRPLYPTQHDFAPRFSLAYSPQVDSGIGKWLFGGPGKTSVRAGWGMFYDLFGFGLMRQANATSLGFSSAISNPATELTTKAPRFTGFFDYPASTAPPAPKGGFPQTAPNVFAIASGLDDKLRAPYTMNMDFALGRELGHGFFVQGSYVGRLSRHSLQGDDVAIPTNLKDPKSGQTYFEAAKNLMQAVNGNVPANKVAAQPFFENIFAGYKTSTQTATQNIYDNYYSQESDATTALTDIDTAGCDPCSIYGPYALFNQQYSSLAVFRSRGSGNYHAMQWTMRKRFSSGYQFDFNYTWSKSIDLGSSRESDSRTFSQIVNPWFPGQQRAVSDYDQRHIFSAFAIAEIPLGRGKRYGTDMNRFIDAVVGGWQLSGILRKSSGLPTYVDNGGFWPTNWNVEGFGTQIAPVSSGVTKNSTTGGPNLFADPKAAFAAFRLTYPGESGSRNSLRGSGYFAIDAGLGKRFTMPWKDSHSFQIRAEGFNITNTVSFDPYLTSANLGNPGSFGKYSGTLGSPRVFQFSGRYEF